MITGFGACVENMKPYSDFIRQDIPEPPEDASDQLVQLFRPETEPSFEDHYNRANYFREWLLQPNVHKERYPADAGKNDTELGVWVYQCSYRWRMRYEEQRMKSELWRVGTQMGFTGLLVAVLGAVGLDLEIEGAAEWAAPGGTVGARVGFPVFYTNRQKKSRTKRNHYARDRDQISCITPPLALSWFLLALL